MPKMHPPTTTAILLLTPLLCTAQQPAPPPFQLDEHGEAHFNIPVVVKLAPSPSRSSAPINRRSDDSDSSSPDEPPSGIVHAPAFSEGRIQLAPPSFAERAVVAEPAFEVTHQGQDSSSSSSSSSSDDDDDDDDDPDIEARSLQNAAAANPDVLPPAKIPEQAIATHTILLIETTGTATSTTSNNDSTAATVDGKLPPAMNHTSFPLRNGTNGTLPCNGTGGVLPTGCVKPVNGTGAGLGAGGVKNPANGATNGAEVKKTGGAVRGRGGVVLGLVLGLVGMVGMVVC